MLNLYSGICFSLNMHFTTGCGAVMLIVSSRVAVIETREGWAQTLDFSVSLLD